MMGLLTCDLLGLSLGMLGLTPFPMHEVRFYPKSGI